MLNKITLEHPDGHATMPVVVLVPKPGARMQLRDLLKYDANGASSVLDALRDIADDKFWGKACAVKVEAPTTAAGAVQAMHLPELTRAWRRGHSMQRAAAAARRHPPCTSGRVGQTTEAEQATDGAPTDERAPSTVLTGARLVAPRLTALLPCG